MNLKSLKPSWFQAFTFVAALVRELLKGA